MYNWLLYDEDDVLSGEYMCIYHWFGIGSWMDFMEAIGKTFKAMN